MSRDSRRARQGVPEGLRPAPSARLIDHGGVVLPELGIVRMVRRLLSGFALKVAVSCGCVPQLATAALGVD